MRVDLCQLALKGASASLARHLADEHGFQAGPPVRITRVWLDTFDNRLYRRGEVLEWDRSDGGGVLTCFCSANGRVHGRLELDQAPRFAAELPPGALHRRLAPVIDNRALLIQATCHCRIISLEQRNEDGKLVLRATLESWQVVDERGRKRGRPQTCLRLHPVKGYRGEQRKVLAALAARADCESPAGHPLQAVLPRLGRAPAAYDPRVSVPLEPGWEAGFAVRRVLLALLDMLQANIPGTVADIDPEFLHELRVAVRRTRTALGELKSVLPPRGRKRFRDGFAWLGQITGPTRDLDVYLEHIDDYRDMLPPERRADLDPLRTFLVAHRRREQQRLTRVLSGKRCRGLLDDWRHWLVTPPRQPPARALETALKVASGRIWRRYKRVRKAGRAITDASPARSLHALRISCKKLRYLLEFFQSLFGARRHRRLIRILKGLQENLGAFQDYEVQAAALSRFAREMPDESEVPPSTLEAIGILLTDVQRRQAAARADFHPRFAAFDTEKNRQLFRDLLRHG